MTIGWIENAKTITELCQSIDVLKQNLYYIFFVLTFIFIQTTKLNLNFNLLKIKAVHLSYINNIKYVISIQYWMYVGKLIAIAETFLNNENSFKN